MIINKNDDGSVEILIDDIDEMVKYRILPQFIQMANNNPVMSQILIKNIMLLLKEKNDEGYDLEDIINQQKIKLEAFVNIENNIVKLVVSKFLEDSLPPQNPKNIPNIEDMLNMHKYPREYGSQYPPNIDDLFRQIEEDLEKSVIQEPYNSHEDTINVERTEYVIEFNNFGDFIDICKPLKVFENNKDCKFDAYLLKSKYYLVIENAPKQVNFILMEYLVNGNISNISKYCLIEHGKKFSKENAIKEFSQF